jgi:uncharacterized repeat protein (TIGR02543 family)
MQRRFLRFGLLGMLVLVGVLAFVSGSSAAITSWDYAIQVPGSAALNAGGFADVGSMSCTTARDCTAGGFYTDGSGKRQAFVVDETNGVWGDAIEVPATDALDTGGDAGVRSVSCATAGNCAAVGFYTDLSGSLWAFVTDEKNGVWHDAIAVPGIGGGDSTIATSVSCAAPGYCSAGGEYNDVPNSVHAFVVDETNGSWGNATDLGLAGSEVFSVSCVSAGNCAAGGSYYPGPIPHHAPTHEAFLVDEHGGAWGTPAQVPGTAALNTGGTAVVRSVSCASDGSCAAGGTYFEPGNVPQAFVVDGSINGWNTTAALNTDGNAHVFSVSCVSAGNCAAGGVYNSGNLEHAFVVDETGGAWHTAIETPGTPALNAGNGDARINSVSCVAVGECAAGGYAGDGVHPQAIVTKETGGSWSDAIQVPGSAAFGYFTEVSSVSCAAVGECAAGGNSLPDQDHAQAFVTGVGVGSTLQGTVTDPNGVPVAGALVEVCSAPNVCPSAQVADGSGGFAFENLAAGSYTVVATSSSGFSYTPGAAGPVAVSGATPPAGVFAQDVALGPPPQAPPAGTSVPGADTTKAGIPFISWVDPFSLETHGCANGSATYTVTASGGVVRHGSMAETPTGSGDYVASNTQPLYPSHGLVGIEIVVTCPGNTQTTVDFGMYIDPSGVVTDAATARPIAGATVTLLRSDHPGGPFVAVPNGSGVMSPANRANPSTTGSDGAFAWDVIAGYYEVTASAPGCTGATAGVFTIPPPVTNLAIALDCGHARLPHLAVTMSTPGVGWVTSTPAGIDCVADTCTAGYATGKKVTLQANAGAGYTFGGWTGSCTGKSTCQVTMSTDRQVTAKFTPNCIVPNVKAMVVADAKAAIRAAHCGIGTVTHVASHAVTKGKVIAQSPVAGTSLMTGAKVKLKVSRGPR